MSRYLFIILCFFPAMIFAQEGLQARPSADIQQFLQSFDAAWNSHQSAAIATLWTADGDFISSTGRWMMGSKQIEKFFEMESQKNKNSIQQTVDFVRTLNSKLMLIDCTVRLKTEDVTEIQHAVYLLTKEAGKLQIVALRMYPFQQTVK